MRTVKNQGVFLCDVYGLLSEIFYYEVKDIHSRSNLVSSAYTGGPFYLIEPIIFALDYWEELWSDGLIDIHLF